MFRKVIGQKPGEGPDNDDQATEPPVTSAASSSSASSSPPASRGSTAETPPAGSTSGAARPTTASRNVLSSDVEIKGTVKFTNDLVVDGRIEGEIHSSGNLTVGENARLKAEIVCSTIVVYGKVHGNMTASDRVELKASAEVVGDIKAKVLSIEPGAIFVGKSTVGTPSTPVAQPQNRPAGNPQQNPQQNPGGA